MKKKDNFLPRIEVINIGSELLFNRVNTDITLISRILREKSFKVSKCTIVGDNKEELKETLKKSLENSDVIILTGGLGPTFDDITREAVSEVLNRKLNFSEEIWKKIEERFLKRGVKPLEMHKKQAYIIEGAKIIENNVGTAPGMIIEKEGKMIIALPGPPAELEPMMEECLHEIEKKYKKEEWKTFIFTIAGLSESSVEEKIRDLIEKYNYLEWTILAHPTLIEILITSKKEFLKDIEKIKDEFVKRFGDYYLGENPPPLPQILGSILKEKKLKLAIAESCTGGLASKLITDIPGSSEYFQGGFITYSNVLKKKILKVKKTTLRKYGAVSKEVAIEMAKGAKKYGKADVSLSFTGIAGPTGGSKEKPVGLVWIGVGLPKNRYFAEKFLFSGNRHRIRERAVYTGFDILRRELLRLK
ncbi:competence/damage-inducible protein A [bacterium]|nr:competence/damage-inducible protein A [bacterium]